MNRTICNDTANFYGRCITVNHRAHWIYRANAHENGRIECALQHNDMHHLPQNSTPLARQNHPTLFGNFLAFRYSKRVVSNTHHVSKIHCLGERPCGYMVQIELYVYMVIIVPMYMPMAVFNAPYTLVQHFYYEEDYLV